MSFLLLSANIGCDEPDVMLGAGECYGESRTHSFTR